MKIEGEMMKRFVVYRTDINDDPYEREGEYDTIEEVKAHKWRLDRHYKIRVDGKFMTRREFDNWAKSAK
ncbi:hypothetical protein [Rhodoplanes sp. Z2-YC6860]|uniref:hypothetical protein n=1 Tax=Rhodoplanes sp. Z2-YC6860 TaxID=674703 RepID=UPI000833D313|nr:hypothetical protein [Rhodoplanes sp. Z2-YC6860]